MNTNDAEPRSHGKKKKADPKKSEKKNGKLRWISAIFFATILISSAISFLSSAVMEDAGVVEAFLVLLFIVLLGVVFDIIGVAVMSADEKPFHSMAAKKVAGATEALRLLRSAEKVSSFCNDVVGDICGVVSGSASAAIAVKALSSLGPDSVGKLLMSTLVAGATIAGKAFGKDIAMKRSTQIVFFVAKPIYYIKSPFRRKGPRKRS